MQAMTHRISLDPARSIIAAVGGPKVVAEVTGVNRTQIWRWTQPTERKGTGGLIPSAHQVKLLQWARANGKPLTAEMFFPAEEAPTG